MDQCKLQIPELIPHMMPWPLTAEFKMLWNRFLASRPCSPFDRIEWIETGVEVFGSSGSRILPLSFLDTDGNIRALGVYRYCTEAGRLGRIQVLRSIEYNSQRILPVLAATLEDSIGALRALRDVRKLRIDYIDLYKIDPMGDDLGQLIRCFTTHNVPHSIHNFNIQPYFAFLNSWEEYLQNRTQGHRKKIRRYTRKLQEAYSDYRFTRLRSPKEFEQYGLSIMVDQIMDLFKKSWQAQSVQQDDNVTLDQFELFYRKIAQLFAPKGWLDVCLLHADDRLIAYDLNLVQEGSVYMLFGAFDPEYADASPGSACLSEILQDGFLRGDSVLEFGGDYLDYKKLWTKSTIPSYHIRIYGRSLRARIRHWVSRSQRG